MALGGFLKDRRQEIGLKREEVAIAIQVSPETIGRWERGEITPTGAHLQDLARVLRFPLDALPGSAQTTTGRLEQISSALRGVQAALKRIERALGTLDADAPESSRTPRPQEWEAEELEAHEAERVGRPAAEHTQGAAASGRGRRRGRPRS